MTDRLSHPDKVRRGSFYSTHAFGTVLDPGHGGHIQTKSLDGFEYGVAPNIIAKEYKFADQFDRTEKVTRTKLIEILTQNPHTAMTIEFNKKPDAKKMVDELFEHTGTKNAFTKTVKTLLAGEKREMVGFHQNTFDEHRRLYFTEAGKEHPRLVDPRTLNFIIVNLVRYEVK